METEKVEDQPQHRPEAIPSNNLNNNDNNSNNSSNNNNNNNNNSVANPPILPAPPPSPITPKKRSADAMASDSIQDLIAKAKQSRIQGPSKQSCEQQQSIDDSLEKELTCAICADIVYRPVALLDCLHTFCGSCVKQWIEQSLRCPSCRRKIKKCKEDHKQGSLVELFFKNHPDKELTVEEKAEKDGIYKLGEKLDLCRDWDRENDVDDDEDDDDGSDEDVQYRAPSLTFEWEPCPTCAPPDPNTYGFACTDPIQPGHRDTDDSTLPGHRRCGKCRKSVPGALLDKMRCYYCLTIACGNLFGEQRCSNFGAQDKIAEVKDVELDAAGNYDSYFQGNTFELTAFLTWKIENDISDKEIGRRIKDWALQTNNNQLKIGGWHARLNDMVCVSCARRSLETNFLDWWIHERERVGLAQNDRRVKCWYGRNCRTQRHNQGHNAKLQHICEELPASERRHTAAPRASPPPVVVSTDDGVSSSLQL